MSDGMNLDMIGDLLSNMSAQDMESLSALAEGLLGGGQKEEKHSPPPKPPFPDFEGMDLESISRIMSIMQKLSSQPSDPGCDLIAALKPLLSPPRRKRADEAISMLRVISLMPIIGEAMN